MCRQERKEPIARGTVQASIVRRAEHDEHPYRLLQLRNAVLGCFGVGFATNMELTIRFERVFVSAMKTKAGVPSGSV